MLEADYSKCKVSLKGGKVPPTLIRIQDYPPGRKTYRFAWFGWLATMIFENKMDHQDFLRPRIPNLDQTL